MSEQQIDSARMRIVGGEAFLVDERGYVFHADSGELGHLEDCTAFAELAWCLFNQNNKSNSI